MTDATETTTTTDFGNIADLPMGDINPELFDQRFEEAATPQRRAFAAGYYFLQMPEDLAQRVRLNERGDVEVSLKDLKTTDPDNPDARFTFVQNHEFGNVISTRKHYNSNGSDLMDLFIQFGVIQKGDALTKDVLETGLNYISGKVTPRRVKCELRGGYKDPSADKGFKPGVGFGKASGTGYIQVYGTIFTKAGSEEVTVTLNGGTTKVVKGYPTVDGGIGRAWVGEK